MTKVLFSSLLKNIAQRRHPVRLSFPQRQWKLPLLDWLHQRLQFGEHLLIHRFFEFDNLL